MKRNWQRIPWIGEDWAITRYPWHVRCTSARNKTQLGQRHTISNWQTEQNIHFECFAAFFNALNHFMVLFNLSERNSSGFCVVFFFFLIWSHLPPQSQPSHWHLNAMKNLLKLLSSFCIAWKPEHNVVTFGNLLNIYLCECVFAKPSSSFHHFTLHSIAKLYSALFEI